MPTFTTCIQHSTGCPSHSNEAKETEGSQIVKEEVKLSIFAEDMFLHIENLKTPPKREKQKNKNTLELTDKFSKAVAFLYISNEPAKKEIKAGRGGSSL